MFRKNSSSYKKITSKKAEAAWSAARGLPAAEAVTAEKHHGTRRFLAQAGGGGEAGWDPAAAQVEWNGNPSGEAGR
jgi:hypothetical protein